MNGSANFSSLSLSLSPSVAASERVSVQANTATREWGGRMEAASFRPGQKSLLHTTSLYCGIHGHKKQQQEKRLSPNLTLDDDLTLATRRRFLRF